MEAPRLPSLCLGGPLGLSFPAGKWETIKQFHQISLEQSPRSLQTVFEVHAGLWAKSIKTPWSPHHRLDRPRLHVRSHKRPLARGCRLAHQSRLMGLWGLFLG